MEGNITITKDEYFDLSLLKAEKEQRKIIRIYLKPDSIIPEFERDIHEAELKDGVYHFYNSDYKRILVCCIPIENIRLFEYINIDKSCKTCFYYQNEDCSLSTATTCVEYDKWSAKV